MTKSRYMNVKCPQKVRHKTFWGHFTFIYRLFLSWRIPLNSYRRLWMTDKIWDTFSLSAPWQSKTLYS